MLKVLQSLGKKNKDKDKAKSKDTNKENQADNISAKTFGGLGRDKLKQDILKHQGMVSAPTLTAAGLALKKQQDKSNAKDENTLNKSNNPNNSNNHQKSSYISSMDLTSQSLDATPSQIETMKVSPIISDDDLLDNLHLNPHGDGLNTPSLSNEAAEVFQLDTELDIPNDDLNSDLLEFPAYVSLSEQEFSLPKKDNNPKNITPPLKKEHKQDDFLIDFKLDDSSSLSLESFDNKDKQNSSNEKNKTPNSLDSLSLEMLNENSKLSNTSEISNNSSTNFDSLSLSLEIPSLDNISVDSTSTLEDLKFNPKSLDKGLEGEDLDFAQQLATAYSEQNYDFVIDSLKEHINSKEGLVSPRFWYMLMDCYQTSNNKEEFEKAAISFAHLFNASPPSWFESDENAKKTVMSGKNILILEPQFKLQQTEKFKPFLKSAKEEKFCRINVSPCKFEMSEPAAIVKLLELFKNLRKARVLSILMGDNNLISFCKNYINPDVNNKMLKEEFIQNEQTFWLLYLEILQWKGQQVEFEDLALEFAIKFEISPPDWEPQGVMRLDNNSKNDVTEDELDSLEKIINSNNVHELLNIITKQFETNKKAEINFSSVESLDFAAAGSISYKIQELWSMPEHKFKKVIFKFPNEMIVTLLELVGVSEFVDIIQRKR